MVFKTFGPSRKERIAALDAGKAVVASLPMVYHQLSHILVCLLMYKKKLEDATSIILSNCILLLSLSGVMLKYYCVPAQKIRISVITGHIGRQSHITRC